MDETSDNLAPETPESDDASAAFFQEVLKQAGKGHNFDELVAEMLAAFGGVHKFMREMVKVYKEASPALQAQFFKMFLGLVTHQSSLHKSRSLPLSQVSTEDLERMLTEHLKKIEKFRGETR